MAGDTHVGLESQATTLCTGYRKTPYYRKRIGTRHFTLFLRTGVMFLHKGSTRNSKQAIERAEAPQSINSVQGGGDVAPSQPRIPSAALSLSARGSAYRASVTMMHPGFLRRGVMRSTRTGHGSSRVSLHEEVNNSERDKKEKKTETARVKTKTKKHAPPNTRK